MKKRVLVWMALALVVVAAAACGGTSSSDAEPSEAETAVQETTAAPNTGGAVEETGAEPTGDPVKLGYIMGLSGPNSVLAPPALQAVELAVAEINASGGILGRPVELVTADDGTDPTIAAQAMEDLVNAKQVDAVVALETSANREAVMPIIREAGIPYLQAELYEGGECEPSFYNLDAVPNQQIDPLVNFLVEESGASKFFLLGADYSWPRVSFEAAVPLIEAAGASVVGTDFAPIGNTDWTSLVSKIQESGADTVLLALVGGSDNVSFIRQLRAAGVEATLASIGLDEATLAAMGDVGEGVFMASSYFNTLDTEANAAFQAALEEKFGGEVVPQTTLSAPSYDGMHLLKLAMEAAGSTDPQAVVDALATVTFDGPRGPIAPNSDHHVVVPMNIGQGTADGTFEIVESLPPIEPSPQC